MQLFSKGVHILLLPGAKVNQDRASYRFTKTRGLWSQFIRLRWLDLKCKAVLLDKSSRKGHSRKMVGAMWSESHLVTESQEKHFLVVRRKI